jgi:glycosyltransferase involved in cell wall biosynthesis
VLAPQPFYQERGTPIAVRIAVESLSKKLKLSPSDPPSIDLLCYHEGEDIQIPGVNIVRIPGPPFLNGIRPGISLKKLLCDVIFLFSALSLIVKNRNRRYDVIHAVEESVFIAWLIKQVWGIPYIYDMDSSLSLQITEKWRWLKIIAPLMNWIEGVAMRGSVAVAPVCDALQVLANEHGSPHTVMLRDVSLLPASEHTDRDRNATLGLSLAEHTPAIVYVGNLEFYQGIDLLLESFTLVQNHPSHPRLIVIGGVQTSIDEYKAKAERLGCAENVSFLGPRPVSELDAFLSCADILVSPRIKGNNTPMKIYSYLHSGRPLVATDLPTHQQVLDSDISMLVPPTAEGFAHGLRALLDDPALRLQLGTQARERAQQLYTVEAFESQLSSLYDIVTEKVIGNPSTTHSLA